jgi:hypothetical protein
MPDLWAALWRSWGAPVQSAPAAHTSSTVRQGTMEALWLTGDAVWHPSRAATWEDVHFSPIPTTTPITTDPYL